MHSIYDACLHIFTVVKPSYTQTCNLYAEIYSVQNMTIWLCESPYWWYCIAFAFWDALLVWTHI